MTNIKTLSVLLLLALSATAVSARDYRLDERAEVDLSGVEEITFDLRGISCALCVRTIDIPSILRGDGRTSTLDLSLAGEIRSNRAKAVPSLVVDESGRRVVIRFYEDRKSFFALNQGGTAEFEAVFPESYRGSITVTGTSHDVTARDFDLGDFVMSSSSGDMTVESVRAASMELEVSSGDFRASALASAGSLSIDSSSGRIDADRLEAARIDVKAGSGDITVGAVEAEDTAAFEASSGDVRVDRMRAGSIMVDTSSGGITLGEAIADDELTATASSGRIEGDRLVARRMRLDTSSGRITVGEVESGTGRIEVSSGDVDLGALRADDVEMKLSSGDLEIGELEIAALRVDTSGDARIASGRGGIVLDGSSGKVDISLDELTGGIGIDVSSGDVTLHLPRESAFDARLKASSGRIESEFPIIGDVSSDRDDVAGSVNGGGSMVEIETSSGDIRLEIR